MNTYTRKINYYETDKMGITHHSNYIRFMEEARVDFLERIGWGYKQMESNGIISPVVSISCNYKKMTTFDDVIEIHVSVKDITFAKLIFNYNIKMDNVTVCTAESVHCFLCDGKPVNIQKKFPQFYEKLCEMRKLNEVV